MSNFILYNENCLDVLGRLEDNSVDSVVTDPPYGLSFMGKKWDYDVPSTEIWAECLRVLKPGGHLLAFAGTRTQHRMAVRIEDAGFEIRDMIAWVYGSGFPKSLDVSKAIDKQAGVEPIDTGIPSARHNSHAKGSVSSVGFQGGVPNITIPATDAAQEWQGWGTALKPALEPITVARKPLIGTVAANVLAHGTGGLNIDGCRVALSNGDDPRLGGAGSWTTTQEQSGDTVSLPRGTVESSPLGRWPANLIHDGSPEVLAGFPQTVGAVGKTKHASGTNAVYGDYARTEKSLGGAGIPDKGSAARFFYCAKASRKDRGENNHPTVKPTDLMRYLVRLVTPPGGTVLDPFMGSGSTGKAAMLEGFSFIGCELSPEYMEIAKSRIESAL